MRLNVIDVPRPALGDLLAGVGVALVLLPQSLAYATLAGMPPRAGLIVAGVATLAAAPFVSSPLLQTGPTAVTSLLTFGSLSALAAPRTGEYVALAALLALGVGAVRVGVGLLRAGELAYLMSQPVVVGFTAAAAIVIAASQVPTLLGVAPPEGATMQQALVVLSAPAGWDPQAVLLGLVTVVLMLFGRRVHPLFPDVLVAVVGGVVYARLTGYGGEVVGTLPALLPTPALDLPWSAAPRLIVPAVVIGLIGFSEASVIARSFAAETESSWDVDREFISQGAANLASGLFGGFPAGASFSRSAVNRLAGGTTAWSGAITGAVVLAAMPLVGVLDRLPVAVIAGIIVGAVLPLMDPRPVLELRHYSRQQLVIASVTFVTTLLVAPQIQWAVVAGIVLAVGAHLRRERLLAIPHWRDGEVLHLRPVGVLYFGSARRLEEQVRAILDDNADVDRLVVHFDAVGRTDVTGAIALRTVFREARRDGVEVEVTDLTPTSRKIVHRVMREADDLPVERPPDPDHPPAGPAAGADDERPDPHPEPSDRSRIDPE